MIKHIPLFLLIGFYHISIAQEQPTKYYGPEWEEIKEEDYLDFQTKKDYLTLFYDLDTAAIGKVFQRETKGRFTKDQRDILYSHLEKISGRIIEKNSLVIINYFPESDFLYYQGLFQEEEKYFEKYSKMLKRYRYVEQFFIAAIENNKLKINGFDLIGDRGQFFENEFFQYYIPYGSYVIVYPSRRFVRYLGDYDFIELVDRIKKYHKKRKK